MRYNQQFHGTSPLRCAARELRRWAGMLRVALVTFTLALSACATHSPAVSDFRIYAFRQGLIGPDSSGKPAIVTEGNDFPYAVNGTCNAAGQRIPCMWHGFEFSYEGPNEVNVLTCVDESSDPYTAVDPTKSYGTGVTTFNFSLKLNGRQGHFINPQYSVWPANRTTAMRHITRCEYGNREVLHFRFSIEAPPNNAIQPTAAIPPIK